MEQAFKLQAETSEGMIKIKIIPVDIKINNELLLVKYTADKIRKELGLLDNYVKLSEEDVGFLLEKLEKRNG
jgi:hypothetical protein